MTRRRVARMVIALLSVASGVAALIMAMYHGPFHRPHTSHVDYFFHAMVGPHYLLLACGLVLILLARGLAHGKRAAWWVAVVCLLGVIATARFASSDAIGLALAFVTLFTLLVCRQLFRARSDPALGRRGLYVIGAGELVVLAYGTLGLYELDSEFRHQSTLGTSVGNALRLLFLLPVGNEPITRHGAWFVESVRGLAAIVLLVGLAMLVRAVAGGPGRARDRRRVEGLLQKYGNNGLAHFQLLDDKAWFFGDDGEAFIGYHVVGTTAVALGGPVGAAQSQRAVLAEFLEFCEANGWTYAFHQLTESERDLVKPFMRTAKIGEEAIVEVQTWSDEGKDYKSLRSAVRRCERAGYRVVELSHPLSDDDLDRIRIVSDEWAANGNHRERTFTLGRFDADYLRSTPVVAVVDEHDTVQAFANLLPSYKDVNASFDLMRRRSDSVNGVMDFLFVWLIGRFKEQGYQGMNLGLAPFAGMNAEAGLKDRAMSVMYERLKVFNYKGLYEFKNKWHPRWEPRFLGYASEADFAKASAATARAGELPKPSLGNRVLANARRYPLSYAFIGFQLWLMTATAISPSVHDELLRALGSNWQTLQRGELWRLFTSPLIQAHGGFSWSNLPLMAVIPVAEHYLRANRVALIYILGDIFSTMPTMFGLRVAEALGSTAAGRVLHEMDGGTSSGTIAVIGAMLAVIPHRRARLGVLAGFVLLIAALVPLEHELFDIQHLLAGMVGVGIAYALPRMEARRRRTNA